jgi:hypothetical protein
MILNDVFSQKKGILDIHRSELIHMNNKLVLFLLVLARKRNQKGYAMLFTTIITIFLLVLVAAATTFADI